ncbi:MAG: hypothetical protein VW450_06780 [Chloroflexota bacterium]
MSANPPSITVRQQGPAAPAGPGRWRLGFDVANAGDAPVRLEAAWLPHGRLRAERHELDALIAPGAWWTLAVEAAFREESGTKVENCFIILRCASPLGERWQVLARFTVIAGEDGAPSCVPEATSVQPVGFGQHA